MDSQEKRKFNNRSFISIAIIASALILVVSGLENHNLQFDPFTVNRHLWMSIHNSSAFLFTLFISIHVYYNWRSLTKYFGTIKNRLISKEAFIAIFCVIVFVGLISSHVFLTR
jgi:hypothetical protein